MSQSNLSHAEKLYTVEEYLAFERQPKKSTNILTGELLKLEAALKLTQWREQAENIVWSAETFSASCGIN